MACTDYDRRKLLWCLFHINVQVERQVLRIISYEFHKSACELYVGKAEAH